MAPRRGTLERALLLRQQRVHPPANDARQDGPPRLPPSPGKSRNNRAVSLQMPGVRSRFAYARGQEPIRLSRSNEGDGDQTKGTSNKGGGSRFLGRVPGTPDVSR